MPTYSHICTDCGFEWEDIYSIHADPPTTCPNCNKETAKRTISYATAGKVELSGQELKDSVKAAGQKLKMDALKDERVMSNLVGEERYETVVKQKEADRQVLRNMFKNKKK